MRATFRALCVSVVCAVLASALLFAAQRPAVTKEVMTVTASVTAFQTATLDKRVGSCVGITETASVRFWTTGDAPTASEWKLVVAGSVMEITGSENLRNFKAIRTGGTSAVIHWECYGVK